MYTIYELQNVTKLGIKVATFKTHLNTYIFLHYPGQVRIITIKELTHSLTN